MENRDAIRQQREGYYKANAARIKARALQWAKDHPEEVLAKVQRRRASKRTTQTELIRTADIWTRDAGTCRLCGAPAGPKVWDLDHLTPLGRGGTHTPDNVAVSHPRCNRQKHALTLEEWQVWRSRRRG